MVPEVTSNVGGALQSLGHVGGAQFPPCAQAARSGINGERAEASNLARAGLGNA